MKATKFIKVNVDTLLNGTSIIIKLNEETKVCICRDMKDLIIFPIIEEGE